MATPPCGGMAWRPFFLGGRCRPPHATYPDGRAETAPEVALHAAPIRFCSRWGLPCRSCCQSRGGLLPHPFTLASPDGEAVCFLWHFPWGCPRRPLAGTVFPGARTFLTGDLSVPAGAAARPTGRAYKGVRVAKSNLKRRIR